MPRLADLLEYLAEPDLSEIWVLLDIKIDNNPDDVMRLIASTIQAAPQPSARPWNQRIVLGIWAAKYLPLCHKYLPDFPISYIGLSLYHARQFLRAPNVCFNMHQYSLCGPCGRRFIREAHSASRPVFAWTVNAENMMKWCIQRGLDGVITDDPKRFNEICDEWQGAAEPAHRPTVGQLLYACYFWFLVLIFGKLYRFRFPETVQDSLKLRQAADKTSTTFD